MKKYLMLPLATVVGGKKDNTRRRGGRLTRVTMNRFVVQGIAGGKKEETFIYIGSITAADSSMLCPVVCTGFTQIAEAIGEQ